jgi:hypothetical protein
MIDMLQIPNFHFTLFLGLPAIILLGIGTLLYEISKEKYTFHHGLCAGTALLLTTINIIGILPSTVIFLSSSSMDLFHLVHIILGVIGYVAGLGAFVSGISGIRTKIPGYTALICWTIVFLMGYYQFMV